jgi:GNAT superfamily N-acetyltransferase
MEPVSVRPDDEAVFAEAYAVRRSAHRVDNPGLPDLTMPELLIFAQGSHLIREQNWLWRDNGQAVGISRLRFYLRENLDAAELFLAVGPSFRRAGRGRTILEHALDQVRAAGRSIVWSEVDRPLTGDPDRPGRFLAAAGFRPALTEWHRVLDVRAVDLHHVTRLRDEAAAAAEGYEIVGWTGRCPDDLAGEYAALNARMITDAPQGDLHIEPQTWDVDRVRYREDLAGRMGHTVIATVARAAGGGPLVAYTDMATTEHDPANAYQWDTLVEPSHRGHRLGMLVKSANLLRLLAEAPAARQVHTWNADSNTHMVAINDALGFRAVQQTTEYQLDLGQGRSELTEEE